MKKNFAYKKGKIVLACIACVSMFMTGCAKEGNLPENVGEIMVAEESVGIVNESAQDMAIDFNALKEENPDIYGWLYIPNTSIDFPIVQSGESDQYYQSHDSFANENLSGAVYTEMATMRDMCDFNTVIRGSKNIIGDVDSFFDPEFFGENEIFYIFIQGNKLTYEIVACYTTEGDSPIREYEFCYAPGCREYISDVFDTRDMTRQLREGWEGLNETNFLVSIYIDGPCEGSAADSSEAGKDTSTGDNAAASTEASADNASGANTTASASSSTGQHTVLVGALIGDEAGNINRAVMEEPEDVDISTLLSLMEEAE